MTISEQLHNSKFHRDGFDPNCPQCLTDKGIDGIIRHLESCAAQNGADSKDFSEVHHLRVSAWAVAAEQRRIVGILKAYLKTTKGGA